MSAHEEYGATYRCRMCHAVFMSGATTGRRTAEELLEGLEVAGGDFAPVTCSHACSDESIGEADRIGFGRLKSAL